MVERSSALKNRRTKEKKIVTAILRLEFWKSTLPHPMTCFLIYLHSNIVFNNKIKSILIVIFIEKGTRDYQNGNIHR